MTALFTYQEGSVLIRLFIAHIVTDFLMQTSKGIADKNTRLLRGHSFWMHGFYTGAVTLVLIWNEHAYIPVILLVASHMLIDYIKIMANRWLPEKDGKELWLFITDQLLHILMIIIVWLMIIKGFEKSKSLLMEIRSDYRLSLRLLAYLIVVGPITYLIKFLTLRWSGDVLQTEQSLEDAGKWIGILERILVVTLVFIEQYTAIGFLATMKSILRLIDKPETETNGKSKSWSSRKHTEYVLIGTLLSFGTAILTAVVINRLLKF